MKKIKNKKRVAVIFLTICILLLTGVISIDLFGLGKMDISSGLKNIFKNDNPVDISGVLISPTDFSGISGADISFGSASIRTDQSGYYQFSGIRPSEGFRVNYPELKKAILKTESYGKDGMLYFDVKMFNELIVVVDLESRGKISEIYKNHLYGLAKNKMSETDFLKNYQSIFNSNNVLDQELVVTKTELLEKEKIAKYDLLVPTAVRIELANGEKRSEFYLVPDGDKWFVIK